jgi:hypothetical protein
MKRDKHSHGTMTQQRLNLKSSVPILFAGICLILLLVGCGKMGDIFATKAKYKIPALPKAQLATIHVDTDKGWVHRINRLVLRIDGQLALDEKIDADKDITIKEILVAPGVHNISVMLIYQSFSEVMPHPRQIVDYFSVDAEAGSSYLLQGKFSPDEEGELSFDSWLADAETGKVVKKSKSPIISYLESELANPLQK